MTEPSAITPDQFGDIFRRNRDKFILIANSYVRDRHAAEDIVAEAFAKFWNNRGTLAPSGIPEAYIMKTVKHLCLNYMRDKLTRMRISQEFNNDRLKALEAETTFLSSEDLGFLFGSDVAAIFRNVMDEFPELTRNIFYASRFDGMTYQEIAQRYSVSERKVKRSVVNVLASLRVALKDYLHIALLAALLGL
ncbi:MAG: sigma-70 family RNA polymerase sigma factor [Candidatus Cryptobacteroides sp.]